MSKLQLPSLLSYSRSIQPSVAYFYERKNDNSLMPIDVITESLRATFGDHKSANGNKTSEDLAAGNIHRIDSAYLQSGSKSLVVKFSLKFMNNSFVPDNSNDTSFSDILNEFIQNYKNLNGFEHLAKLYVTNVVTGKFLWRNKNQSKSLSIKVSTTAGDFNFEYELENESQFLVDNNSQIEELSSIVAKGLSGESGTVILNITSEQPMCDGEEVFPSQEFIDSSENSKKDRTLSSIIYDGNKRQAIFHSSKIGNAIRTIDTWFENSDGRAIAVEPLGIDRIKNIAIRHKTKRDIFTLLEKNLVSFNDELQSIKSLSEISDQDIHFVAACLIRGGLFSGNSKKK